MTNDEARGAVVGDILVVDDTPANLKALAAMLGPAGYRVRPVSSGTMALQAARAQPPDLILLDISMPDMDGYAVCRALKAEPTLAKIPVIFISAHSEPLDKVEAFAVGGVDYVTKPFSIQEVEARVAIHLRIRRHALELEACNAKLVEAERLRDGLVHMLVHDLRSPLAAILSLLDLLRGDAVGVLSTESVADIDSATEAARRMVQMVTAVLDVSQLEAGQMSLTSCEVDMLALARQVGDGARALVEGRSLEVVGDDGARVVGDGEVLFRVLQNLLSNALKFATPRGLVRIEVRCAEEGVRVTVDDDGPGVPEEHRPRVFEKFGQLGTTQGGKKQPWSTGLGLPFCKLAVEAHGGKIGIEGRTESGMRVWLTLPRRAAAAAK